MGAGGDSRKTIVPKGKRLFDYGISPSYGAGQLKENGKGVSVLYSGMRGEATRTEGAPLIGPGEREREEKCRQNYVEARSGEP